MIFVPFIYFALLTAYWWKKHDGLDLCVYISGLYTISSFFAVIVVLTDTLGVSGILFNVEDLELNLIPTILFCAFLTLTFLPFSLIHTKKIESISSTMPWVIDGLASILIIVGLINFYAVFDSTAEILSGNLWAVREAAYAGDATPAQIKIDMMPAIFKYFYTLNFATILALPLYFYYLCCLKRPWWFMLLLLLASLSGPLAAIQAADRNEFVYYGMMFIYCVIFFYRLMSKKVRRGIYIISGVFATLFATYLIAVSVARFDKSTEGASGSIAAYAGQGYLNFCFFWENANFDLVAPEREFPMTFHTLAGLDSDDFRRNVRSGQQGFFISVFPTFLGEVMLDLSPIGMISWAIYYFLACMLIIKMRERTEYDIGEVVAIFTLAAIPIFGIFYYRYFYYTHALITIISALLYLCSKFKLVYK